VDTPGNRLYEEETLRSIALSDTAVLVLSAAPEDNALGILAETYLSKLKDAR
jgi:translation elongation factor EF-1alpha